MRPSLVLISTIALLSACSGGAAPDTPSGTFSSENVSPAAIPAKAHLGRILSSARSGQIIGFDVDQNGGDGLLSEYAMQRGGTSSIETFDIKTAKVTQIDKTAITGPDDDFETFGLVGGDVGFVDDQRISFKKGEARHDRFFLLNPASQGKVTARWQPPHPTNSVLYQSAENQNTNTQFAVVFRHAFMQNVPWIYVWNSSTNRFLNFIRLTSTGEAIAEDTSSNTAVLAGQAGNGAPIFTLVDLQTGKSSEFNGLNNGPDGAGAVNGLAVDSADHMACTTTELNAQVEIYDLKKKTGFAVQLPGTGSGSQLNSGTAVASDSVNRLFLVGQPVSSTSQSGSSIDVYDENGDLIETLNGFNFFTQDLPQPRISINPSLRIGWVNGPQSNQLQQFYY